MVGNLAERAAEAIGADPLLARVAAYYHDIGKLANPLAFIENQAGGENIHDELDPEVSAQILKQHVADGIDIAYKSRLPKPLIAFIPQHHGTAIMSYFYARAKEPRPPVRRPRTRPTAPRPRRRSTSGSFRHAGPKPQSREAALIMLADGVEASVRSLASRDEPAIRAMVARIIDERLADGQFDECDLTLRDIERIREAFVQQLLGMYHQRIAYPQNKVVEIESRRAAGGEPARGRVSADLHRRRGASTSRSGRASRRRSRRAALADGDRRRRSPRPGRHRRPRSGSSSPTTPSWPSSTRPIWATTGPTDVLSFPLLPARGVPAHAGGPAAGAPRPCRRRIRPAARARGRTSATSSCRWSGRSSRPRGRGGQTGDVRWSPADELRLLVTHGTLHVCGWDHAEPAEEAAMRALEQRLLGSDEPARGAASLGRRRVSCNMRASPGGLRSGTGSERRQTRPCRRRPFWLPTCRSPAATCSSRRPPWPGRSAPNMARPGRPRPDRLPRGATPAWKTCRGRLPDPDQRLRAGRLRDREIGKQRVGGDPRRTQRRRLGSEDPAAVRTAPGAAGPECGDVVACRGRAPAAAGRDRLHGARNRNRVHQWPAGSRTDPAAGDRPGAEAGPRSSSPSGHRRRTRAASRPAAHRRRRRFASSSASRSASGGCWMAAFSAA